jgi:phosphoglucomutase
VESPNPQDREGFAGAIALARENDVDLIIGTDPDADRIGIVVRDRTGEYVTLSGNQVGVLLLDYIIRAKKERGALPPRPAVLKSIVTTEMVRAVADRHGVTCYDTFTGFKFLAEKIGVLERTGEGQYILAFEESYGYLTGDGCRDKDAVTAAVLVTEMAAWYHKRGLTLAAAMEALYREYGYFREETLNVVMPGLDGIAKIGALLADLRANTPKEIGGAPVLRLRDYQDGTVTDLRTVKKEKMALSGSHGALFRAGGRDHFVVRPSETERSAAFICSCAARTPRTATGRSPDTQAAAMDMVR